MMSSMGEARRNDVFRQEQRQSICEVVHRHQVFDVAGEDEAKELLTEIVDYLHNPQKYSEIGASMPKGALLVDHPEQVRHFWRKRLPERRRFPSSPFPVLNLWKCS